MQCDELAEQMTQINWIIFPQLTANHEMGNFFRLYNFMTLCFHKQSQQRTIFQSNRL